MRRPTWTTRATCPTAKPAQIGAVPIGGVEADQEVECPGIAIVTSLMAVLLAVTILAFNLLADGLREISLRD